MLFEYHHGDYHLILDVEQLYDLPVKNFRLICTMMCVEDDKASLRRLREEIQAELPRAKTRMDEACAKRAREYTILSNIHDKPKRTEAKQRNAELARAARKTICVYKHLERLLEIIKKYEGE